MKTGPLNLITDVAGLHVGNAEDSRLRSGVTAVLFELNQAKSKPAMRKSKAASAYDYGARPDGCSSKPCCAAR